MLRSVEDGISIKSQPTFQLSTLRQAQVKPFQRSNARREHRHFNLPLRQFHHLNSFLFSLLTSPLTPLPQGEENLLRLK